MRLMLGYDVPTLLVTVKDDYDPTNFVFDVVNGCWTGRFVDGSVTVNVHGVWEDSSRMEKIKILCYNQNRLRGEYQDVFNNFHNEDYVAPEYAIIDFDDSDIAF
jgi:hypothetical protein